MCDLLRKIRLCAQTRPDAVALQCGLETMTYAGLYGAATRMAGRLRELDVRDGATVAVCYPRSFEQIVAVLAVMQAGGAYVPLDPVWPRERVASILKDSGAAVLLAGCGLEEIGRDGLRRLSVHLECGWDGGWEFAEPRSDTLAYVIYTSGSTGAPKGVEITHGNLDHLIGWHTEAFAVTSEDRASHLAGLGFDASVWEVWPYLAVGACVCLVDDAVRSSAGLLQKWMVSAGITVGFVPTPLAEPMMLMDWPEETRLRLLLTGGDWLHHGPKAGQPFTVVNNYGPTECTVVATSGVVRPGTGIPTIGRAITGGRIYVMDEQARDMARGEVGELYVGGAGVGRGYRGEEERSSRCFVWGGAERGRLYRTGDFGCLMADGEVAFRGRVDRQVKIRGQRIELEEIVGVLSRHAGVAFSTVATAGEGEEKHLVGYVLAEDGFELTACELQEFLARWLPSSMIPSVFVRLSAAPLSANGKVDRAALPAANVGNVLSSGRSRGAETVIEETMLGIVRTLLKTEAVRVENDFFLMGGHSLMGTRLVMRIREAFGVRFTLRDLFEARTVARLASHVEALLVAELESMSEEEAAALEMGG